MMSDASDMLAAALEQMDGIIAGKHLGQLVHLAVSVLLCHTWRAEFQAEKGMCLVSSITAQQLQINGVEGLHRLSHTDMANFYGLVIFLLVSIKMLLKVAE